MPNPLVECIPNFSDARRPEVIDQITTVMRSVADVTILDRHSDIDHNRTVITLIGAPECVEAAMFAAIRAAAELIDLDQHSGEHPRIGATDVVPFVPIRDISMQECVEIARRLAKRVADELQIPVYLYEEAATLPERKNLENIRRGEYETLKKEIETVPARRPDFGPARLGPAGAIVIGARQPLIAYNIYLTTDDVTIATKIAQAVRHSSGGLRFVKAIGLLVEGRAQVSMNLTNFRQTPLHRVVEMVRREAERYGVGIHHSELVGMIPQDALINTAVWYTQLDQFEPDQVLETRMRAALPAATAAPSAGQFAFLDDLARGTAAPGGGSAAAFAAAASAALAAMVSRLTIGKKKYAAVESDMQAILNQAEALRSALTAAVQEDAAAFENFMAALKLPKETPAEQVQREARMQAATDGTIQVPRRVARQAVEALELVVRLAETGNLNAISDAGSGAALARAALTGAGLNVRINCMNFADKAAVQVYLAELDQLNQRAAELETRIHRALVERSGLSL